jgi:phosphoglycerol transferase
MPLEPRRGRQCRRVPRWPTELETQPPELTVATLRESGFRAMFVDRFGYADNGEALIALLTSVTPPAGTSPDGRYVWFDLEAAGGG